MKSHRRYFDNILKMGVRAKVDVTPTDKVYSSMYFSGLTNISHNLSTEYMVMFDLGILTKLQYLDKPLI